MSGNKIFFLFGILYFLTRLYRLETIPIFFDESIFIRFAKIIATTNHQWFISLSGQKNIGLIWSIVPFIKILPDDMYLIAGRLPSVLAGLLTMFLTYNLGKILFSSRVGLIAALLYVFSPFTFFYNRMALYDSILMANLTAAVTFAVISAKNTRFKYFFLWGASLGFAFLTKATTIIYFFATPTVYFLSTRLEEGKIIQKLLLVTSALGLSQILNHSIIISSGYQPYMQTSLSYTPTLGELLRDPFSLFIKNADLSWYWIKTYITLPIISFSIMGFIFSCIYSKRNLLIFPLLILSPVIIFSFFGQIYFPRYLLFITPYLLILCAVALAKIPKILMSLTLILLLIQPFVFMGNYFKNPQDLNLPIQDKWQYIYGFPSTYGFEPIYKYLEEKTRQGKIILYVQGSYSHIPYALELKFWGNKDIVIKERWPFDKIDDEMITDYEKAPVYFMFRDNTLVEPKIDYEKAFPIKILVIGTKPGGEDKVYLAEFAKVF